MPAPALHDASVAPNATAADTPATPPDNEKIWGATAIAAEVTKILKRSVCYKTVQRYARAQVNPLPIFRRRDGRIYTYRAMIELWAKVDALDVPIGDTADAPLVTNVVRRRRGQDQEPPT